MTTLTSRRMTTTRYVTGRRLEYTCPLNSYLKLDHDIFDVLEGDPMDVDQAGNTQAMDTQVSRFTICFESISI